MAGKPTRIDVSEARQQNARLRASSTRFSDAVQKMKAAAAAHEGCWGSDQIGATFAKSYKPSADKTLDYSGQAGVGLADTATAVDTAITNFENTDENNANSL